VSDFGKDAGFALLETSEVTDGTAKFSAIAPRYIGSRRTWRFTRAARASVIEKRQSLKNVNK
jgi:hypothetical protein